MGKSKLVLSIIFGCALIPLFSLNYSQAVSFEFAPDSQGTFDDWINIGGTDDVDAITDSLSTTFLESQSNNNHETFVFDFSSLSGFRIDEVNVRINAETTVSQGATKLELTSYNGTHLLPDADIFLTVTASDYWYNMTVNPHTSAPWDLTSLQNLEFGFSMQTDAKRTLVHDFDIFIEAVDVEPPVITPNDPADITIEGNTLGGAILGGLFPSFTAVDNVDGVVPVDCGTNDETTLYPVGTMSVTCSAVDAAGNEASVSFDIIVTDLTPPELSPSPIADVGPVQGNTLGGATLENDPTFSFPVVTAVDIVDGSVPVDCGTNNDSTLYPVGTTTETCTAVDAAGNEASDSFDVIIIDTIPPVITLNGDDTVNVEAFTGSYTEDGATADDIVDGVFAATVGGDIVDVNTPGTYTITYDATDAAGNVATQVTRTVIVEDTTPPEFTFVPVVAPVDAESAFTPVTVPLAIATDASGVATITHDLPATCAGETDPCFDAGTTIVTWTATDSSGNFATATTDVVVNPLPLDFNVIRLTGSGAVEFLDDDDNLSTQIEDTEDLIVTDYRGNVDRTVRDTVIVTSTSLSDTANGGSGVPTKLLETGPNTSVFRNTENLLFFTADETANDLLDTETGIENDFLHVQVLNIDETAGIATMTYQSPSSSPSSQRSEISGLVDSEFISTKISDGNGLGFVANSVFRAALSSDAYLVETTASGSVFDAAFINGQVDTLFGKANFYNEAGEFVITPLKEASDANGNVINDGVFHTTILVTLSTAPTDKNLRILHVDPNNPNLDEIEFLYNVANPPPRAHANIFAPTPGLDPAVGAIGVNLIARDNCALDTDGDALCDNWELPGIGLLVNNTYFLPCVAGNTIANDPTGATVCPDPLRKDVYVEIDYMKFHKPHPTAIADVVRAFHEGLVKNPGGNQGQSPNVLPGVALHIIVNEDMSTVNSGFANHLDLMPYSEFLNRKTFYFGTAAERAGINGDGSTVPASKLLTSKRQAFHYGMFIHSQAENPGASGIGEIGGNDFIVSLGDFANGQGTVSEQAATIMHELGHNLKLEHGGGPGNTVNCKPNYLSIMNYLFQFNTIVTDRPLDYSRQTKPTLLTSSLIEANGVAWQYRPLFYDASGLFQNYPNFPSGTTPILLNTALANAAGDPVVVPTGANIDWNQNGVIDASPVSADITDFNEIVGCGPTNLSLTGYTDWTNLDFNFRDEVLFTSSGSPPPDQESNRQEQTSILAQTLNPIRNEIRALPDSACKTELENQEATIRAEILQAIKTRGEILQSTIDALTSLQNSLTTGVCQGQNTGGVGGATSSTNEEFLEAASGTITMEIRDVEIDISSNGVIDIMIFGKPGFDVFKINPPTVFLGALGDELNGADIVHEFSSANFKKQHYKDDNQDGLMDLFLHFAQNEINGDPNNNSPVDNKQDICVVGEMFSGQDFTGCYRIHVSAGGGGPPGGGGKGNK